MIKRIYLIHAPAQSGKDTCAYFLKKELEKHNKKVIVAAFADYVRFTLEKYFEISDFKSQEGRTIIQKFATELVRGNDEEFWARTLSDFLKAIETTIDVVIIPDWRFKNELEILEKNFSKKIKKIFIARPNNEKTDNMTEKQRNHSSETELDGFTDYDYTIINKTGELGTTYSQIVKIVEEESND